MTTPYRTSKRALPLLESVQVASPCSAEWSEMVGDDRVRFCGSCEKNVYNLSAMLADDAERLLMERAGKDLCVRFYQRADGTMMTADCPVGVTRKRRKKVALAVAGAGALAFGALASLRTTHQGLPEPPAMGEVAVMGAPPVMVPPVMGGGNVDHVIRQAPIAMGTVAVPPVPPPVMGEMAPVETKGKISVVQGGRAAPPGPPPVRPIVGRMAPMHVKAK